MSPGRQLRLAEVGASGQARIAAATVALASGTALARDVERRYLEGAGARVTDDTERARDALPSLAQWTSLRGGAREVLEGSLRALIAVRRALAQDGTGTPEGPLAP